MPTGCQGCRDGSALPFAIQAAFQPIIDLQDSNLGRRLGASLETLRHYIPFA